MARTHPSGWRALPATGARARELATLAALADGLADDFTIYHGLHWTRAEGGRAIFGEIAFAVVGPGGRVLLIEQHAGFLDEGPEGLVRSAGARRPHRISVELARSADALRARLRPLLAPLEPALDILFHCPDYLVRQPGTAGLDPSRIVDAGRRGHRVHTESLADGRDGALGGGDVERQRAAGEARGIEVAEHHAGVGHRRPSRSTRPASSTWRATRTPCGRTCARPRAGR